jgi:hypothetical protein
MLYFMSTDCISAHMSLERSISALDIFLLLVVVSVEAPKALDVDIKMAGQALVDTLPKNLLEDRNSVYQVYSTTLIGCAFYESIPCDH